MIGFSSYSPRGLRLCLSLLCLFSLLSFSDCVLSAQFGFFGPINLYYSTYSNYAFFSYLEFWSLM
jgi:hypothetical protein